MVTFRECLYTLIDGKYELSSLQKTLLMVGLVLLCIAIGYLLGSLNFGVIVSKLRYRDDVRNYGSGNAGATNMLRTYGKGAAAITLAGDMLKAAVAVVIGGLLWIDGAYIAGLFCVIGHIFPCWYRFKGGKGVATLGMVILMTNPLVFLIMLAVFLGIVAFTKYVSLGSIMGALLYPMVLNAFSKNGEGVVYAFLMAVLVLFMHRGNMKRLLEKTEPKTQLFEKKKADEVKVFTEDESVEKAISASEPVKETPANSHGSSAKKTNNTNKSKHSKKK